MCPRAHAATNLEGTSGTSHLLHVLALPEDRLRCSSRRLHAEHEYHRGNRATGMSAPPSVAGGKAKPLTCRARSSRGSCRLGPSTGHWSIPLTMKLSSPTATRAPTPYVDISCDLRISPLVAPLMSNRDIGSMTDRRRADSTASLVAQMDYLRTQQHHPAMRSRDLDSCCRQGKVQPPPSPPSDQ